MRNNETHYNDDTLMELFIEFYQVIVSIKASIVDGYRSGVLSDLTEGSIPGEYIQNQIIQCLQTQENSLRKHATAAMLETYEKSKYAMIALTDELFLFEQLSTSRGWWTDADVNWWAEHLLEERLFGSTLSGDNLYDNISELLKKTNLNPDEKELAGVYLITLKLGFKGKFHNANAKQLREWEKYKEALLVQVGSAGTAHRIPKLFPTAYKYNLNPLKRTRLAPLSRWGNYFFLGFTLFIFVSYFTWHSLTFRLASLLGQ